MTRPLRKGRAALLLVTLAFAASASLRLGSVVGEAMASGGEAAPAAEPLMCPDPPMAVAEALALRESRLSAAEASLTERQAAIDLANEVLQTRFDALQVAEEKLAATVAQADGAAEADVVRLTAVYESMKPKEAAQLFELMDPEFAAGFLGRMQPAPAAAILSGMTPEKGYAVSVLLAGRNALAPKE